MFFFILFYVKKIYFSRVKKVIRAYEVLQKALFSDRDIRKCIVLASTEKMIFISDVFVFLIEVAIIELSIYCDTPATDGI
jgi:hypothetical protein